MQELRDIKQNKNSQYNFNKIQDVVITWYHIQTILILHYRETIFKRKLKCKTVKIPNDSIAYHTEILKKNPNIA